jgi:hypothetical protein
MFTTYFLQQNKLIKEGKHAIIEATKLDLKTVGLINAMTDIEPMALGWLDYAMNNTYDHPIINETAYKTLLTSMTDPKEGCFTLLHSCRAAQARRDPEMKGNDHVVNKACAAASVKCLGIAFTGVNNDTLVSCYLIADITRIDRATV